MSWRDEGALERNEGSERGSLKKKKKKKKKQNGPQGVGQEPSNFDETPDETKREIQHKGANKIR